MQKFGWLVVREDLANLCHEDGPRNTAQVAHDIWRNTSIFGPNLDDSESLFEVFSLFSSEFEDHKVILPT